jgi:hypothetical protein
MRVLLVRWPEKRPLPRGTFGIVRSMPGRPFCIVKDPDRFDEWACVNDVAESCGHVPRARERLLRERLVKEWLRDPWTPVPDGLQIRTDGVTRLRVWPVGVRDVAEVEAFLWESPVEVVAKDGRVSRSMRRAKWKR